MKNKMIFVLTYLHRHGADVSVYASEGKAEDAALRIMLAWFDELKDRFGVPESARRRLKKYIKNTDYPKAADTWRVYTDESFDIDEHTIN